jgi:hypothetical protein
VELTLFDEVAEALRSLAPPELDGLHQRARPYGIKVWFGQASPPREHYEAQVINARHVADASVLAIEVGFHAEHPKVADNDAVLVRLLRDQRTWRRTLGKEAIAGPFLGRPDDWRRVSETWPDPDLGDPDLGLELATRLLDYMVCLEPWRSSDT